MKKRFVLIALSTATIAACGGAGPSGGPETPAPSAARPEATTESRGVGVVESVDRANRRVTIAHEPIESLGWPAMTMGFAVSRPELLENVTAGQRIEFTLEGSDMSAVVTSIEPTN